MSKIRKELEKVIGTKQEKDEDYQEYLERLVDESDGLSDKKFDGLSEDAQGWLNKAVTALDKNKEIKDFSDAEPEVEEKEEKPAKKGKVDKKEKKAPKSKAKKEKVEEEEEAEEEWEEEAEEGTKKGKADKKKKAPDKKADKKADKAEKEGKEEKPAKKDKKEKKEKKEKAPKKEKKEKKERKIDKNNPTEIVRQMVCKNPKVTVEKIQETLDKKGVEFKEISIKMRQSEMLAAIRILTELGKL